MFQHLLCNNYAPEKPNVVVTWHHRGLTVDEIKMFENTLTTHVTDTTRRNEAEIHIKTSFLVYKCGKVAENR
jgi:hypothetical protein